MLESSDGSKSSKAAESVLSWSPRMRMRFRMGTDLIEDK